MIAGYLQFCPHLNNLEKTISVIDVLTPEHMEVDLLVLPELANSGYNFPDAASARLSAEPAQESKYIRFLQNKCKQLQCSIVSGFNELDGDKLYNSSVLVDSSGLKGLYRKLHLFNTEKLYFQPGNLGLPVFDIGLAKIGMLICFDWVFPEAWRAMALKGVDIICHPSNLVLPGFAQQAVPAHALINRIYAITANRIGKEAELTFTGRSLMADPRGRVLSRASETGNYLFVTEIDLLLARNKQITERNHLFDDRRPEEYF